MMEALGLTRVSQNYPIFTCGEKKDVLEDLTKIQSFVTKEPALSTFKPFLEKRIQIVKSGQIKIDSFKEHIRSRGN